VAPKRKKKAGIIQLPLSCSHCSVMCSRTHPRRSARSSILNLHRKTYKLVTSVNAVCQQKLLPLLRWNVVTLGDWFRAGLRNARWQSRRERGAQRGVLLKGVEELVADRWDCRARCRNKRRLSRLLWCCCRSPSRQSQSELNRAFLSRILLLARGPATRQPINLTHIQHTL
jgi:hypothetical protein